MKKFLAVLMLLCMAFTCAMAEDAAPAPEAKGEGVMTYAEYADADLYTEVTIEAYVQATQSWWDNKITVYAQDDVGGYFIYEMVCTEEDAAKLTEGAKIRVKGEKIEYAGEVEIGTNPTFELLEGTYVAEAKDLTAVLGTDEIASYMNQKATFKGLKLEKLEHKYGEPGDDIYVTLSKDGTSYDFVVERYLTDEDTEVYQAVGDLSEGDVIDVVGFLYWYEGPYAHITNIYDEYPSTIKIGGIGPLTGGAGAYGIAARNGAQIAIDEINAKGGLQFTLDFRNDMDDAQSGVDAYNDLKDWGMQILYGCVTSDSCAAVAEETYADRYFQLTPSASAAEVTDGRDNVFRMCSTDYTLGVAAADFTKAGNLCSKIAVLYNNTEPSSMGIANAFMDRAKELGLTIVAELTFPDNGNTDFSTQLNEAKSSGADMLFFPICHAPASLILAQAEDIGYAPVFFGADGLDGILTLDGFNTDLAEGLLLLTPFNADAKDLRTLSFVETYTETYGAETLNQFAAEGYDCIYAIYEACRKNGITADFTPEAICDALIATFSSEEFVFNGLTGLDVCWNAAGETEKTPMVIEIVDGAYDIK